MLDMLLIGVGGHGRSILCMNQESQIVRFVAISDSDESRAREAGEEFGIATRFTDVGEALDTSGANAVYIAAASPAHHMLVKMALDRGLHVMVEKPFAFSMSEADELISLAARKGLTLSVNQNYRFMDVVMKLREAIDTMLAGVVQYVCADFFMYYEGHPYQRTMNDFMLFEMAVHHVDMCRYLLRSDIYAVEARAWNAKNSLYRGDPSVHAVYDMACGVPVFYTGSLLSKGHGSEWPGRWRIQCESGSLHLDDLGQGYAVRFWPLAQRVALPLVCVVVMAALFYLCRFQIYWPPEYIPEGNQLLYLPFYWNLIIQSFQKFNASDHISYRCLQFYGSWAAVGFGGTCIIAWWRALAGIWTISKGKLPL